MKCPECGELCGFIGFDDGAGDYGELVCEQFLCPACDAVYDGECYAPPPAVIDLRRDCENGGAD